MKDTIAIYVLQAYIYGIIAWLLWRKRKDIKVLSGLELTYYDWVTFTYWWIKLKKHN